MRRLVTLTLVVLAAHAAGAAAMPYSHPFAPAGAYEGAAPRAYVLLIHGGGWYYVGEGMTGFMQSAADRLARLGYAGLNVDYRRGAEGLRDVLRFHDRLRAQTGPGVPICTYGDSSGGHLALLVAERRTDVACVIAEAAPTWLPGLHGGLARLARHWFGSPEPPRWSPALRRLRQPALLAYASADPDVPYRQGRRMRTAADAARLIAVRPGAVPWVHSTVRASDIGRVDRAQAALLARVSGG